jgi:hypothetical protein
MPSKFLTPKQTAAAARALRKQGGLPEVGRCKSISKNSSKKLPIGELPRGVSMQVCRYDINDKVVVLATTTRVARKRKTLSGSRRRR